MILKAPQGGSRDFRHVRCLKFEDAQDPRGTVKDDASVMFPHRGGTKCYVKEHPASDDLQDASAMVADASAMVPSRCP